MIKTAFTLGIKPDEFWSMIPREFFLLVEAYNEEVEREFEVYQHLLAWHAANIMNASGNLKRSVTVDKLLGKNKKKKVSLSREEQKKKLEDLKRKFGY
jgi:Phage tail assembly chaperone protein, TAC